MRRFRCIKTATMEPTWTWNHHWQSNRKKLRVYTQSTYKPTQYCIERHFDSKKKPKNLDEKRDYDKQIYTPTTYDIPAMRYSKYFFKKKKSRFSKLKESVQSTASFFLKLNFITVCYNPTIQNLNCHEDFITLEIPNWRLSNCE